MEHFKFETTKRKMRYSNSCSLLSLLSLFLPIFVSCSHPAPVESITFGQLPKPIQDTIRSIMEPIDTDSINRPNYHKSEELIILPVIDLTNKHAFKTTPIEISWMVPATEYQDTVSALKFYRSNGETRPLIFYSSYIYYPEDFYFFRLYNDSIDTSALFYREPVSNLKFKKSKIKAILKCYFH